MCGMLCPEHEYRYSIRQILIHPAFFDERLQRQQTERFRLEYVSDLQNVMITNMKLCNLVIRPASVCKQSSLSPPQQKYLHDDHHVIFKLMHSNEIYLSEIQVLKQNDVRVETSLSSQQSNMQLCKL